MNDGSERFAPGWPGIQPRWTSSAKTGIGTALTPHFPCLVHTEPWYFE